MITLDTTTFLEHKMGVLRFISNFRDKKNSTESGDRRSAPLIFEKLNFPTSVFFLKIQKTSPKKFSRKLRRKFHGWGTENHDKRPLSYLKPFLIPELLWNTGEFLCETFRYCRTKQFQRKIVTILPRSHPKKISAPEVF